MRSDFDEDGKKDYNMQSEHACMAIAQGGLTGRGPGNSIQRNILPHAYSDFIYAILIEEYGFGGGVLVMILYLVILFRSVKIGQSVLKYSQDNPRGQPNLFPALLAYGLGITITAQALIHMGVNTGAFPVTGQTLPLISLGGTSLLFTSATLGIILNVAYTFSPEYLEKTEMDFYGEDSTEEYEEEEYAGDDYESKEYEEIKNDTRYREMEEELEDDINRDELRDRYYGKNFKPRSKPRTPVYIFKPEDLSNELLIDQIEAIPTARRTREQLLKLKEFTQHSTL
jgi:hypothetical protein